MIEWPPGEAAPTKYWLSNLPAKTKFRDLVDITKMRWRIERDYQELKQEIGLDHYEGRGWRGFPSAQFTTHPPTRRSMWSAI